MSTQKKAPATPFILNFDKANKKPAEIKALTEDVERTKEALKYKDLKGNDTSSFLSVANQMYNDYIAEDYSEEELLSCATRIAQARV